tara:strand:+ start:37437 stop:38510 length:1074 start_codon:yes stop_codon:yes gene_type:complete
MPQIEEWALGRDSCYVLPSPSDFSIDDTLVLPQKNGGNVAGLSGGQYVPENHAFRGLLTAILWHGDNRSPAVEMQGVEQSVERITIVDAPVGVLSHKPAIGLCTGRCCLRDVWLSDCTVGVQAGLVEEEDSCDCLVLDRVFFHGCVDSCVKLINAESTGHKVSGCWFLSMDADCFVVEGGGDLWVSQSTVANAARLLRLTGRRAITPANASYVFEKIKIAEEAGPLFELVRMDHATPSDIVFRDCHVECLEYEKNNGRMFVVQGATALTLEGIYNLQGGVIEWHHKRRRGPDDLPNIIINRSRLAGVTKAEDVLNTSESSGPAHVVVRDCYRSNGQPIEDFCGIVHGALEQGAKHGK